MDLDIVTRDILNLVGAGYLLLLSWIGTRQINRIDQLERHMRETISRADHDAAIASLRIEMREANRDINARLDQIVNLLMSRPGAA